MLRAGLFALGLLIVTSVSMPTSRDDISVHRDTRAELADVNLAAAVEAAQEQAGDTDGGLPVAWCGDPRGDDYAGGVPAGSPQFKVVYAFAADRPNRFDGWKDALQADVAITERFLSAQSGGHKAVRFDMGTNCGPQYADIGVVALPGPRANYADNFAAIANAVRAALGPAAGPRNTIILADSLAGSGTEYGLGETFMGPSGEQAGAANPHNRGGLSSVLFSRDGVPAPGAAAHGWWPEGFLHELTHNLGAVQWSAPHSTQPPGQSDARYGHCWQGADVMCYTEDAGAAHAMVTDCAPFGGMITQSYDCGHDDYFNPAPDAGSYLATHWNTYDNVFLAPCAEIAPACGGGELWVPKPPAATDAPTINGSPRRGTALQVDTGAWINRPTSYGFQWQRLTARGWGNIAAATQSRYTPTSADLGRRLRVVVVAGNTDGEAGTTSPQTAPVAAIAINRTKRATRSSKKSRKPAHVKRSRRERR